MATTETIPTKFPEQEVRIMDNLVQRGIFISRSDLIRSATREKMKESIGLKSDLDLLTKQMKNEGDFNSIEGKILSLMFLEQKNLAKESNFNKAEQKVIRKFLRHPFKILKKVKGMLVLTENGQSIARGYLKGLTHAKTLF